MDDYGIMLLRREIAQLESNCESGYDEFSIDALESAYRELCELEKEGVSEKEHTYAMLLKDRANSEIKIGELFRVVWFEEHHDMHYGRVICAKLERVERKPHPYFIQNTTRIE